MKQYPSDVFKNKYRENVRRMCGISDYTKW